MSSKVLDQFLETNLEDLKEKGLFNTIDVLEGSNGPIITVNGKKMINLASNNYLGFATRPELIEADVEERNIMVQVLEQFGQSMEL